MDLVGGGGAPPLPLPHEGGALTASSLTALSPDEQKQLLGERLFPLIDARVEADGLHLPGGERPSGRITGMLL